MPDPGQKVKGGSANGLSGSARQATPTIIGHRKFILINSGNRLNALTKGEEHKCQPKSIS
jgi:hypothetical protein